MTGAPVSISPADACDLIAAYGGNPARWPAEQRAALLALAAADARVANALADARALDAALDGWADDRLVVPAALDLAAVTRLAQQAPVQPGRVAAGGRWRPALLAASLALVLAVGGWLGLSPTADQPPRIAVVPPLLAGAGDGSGGDPAFAYVFSPTATEEDLI
jgi:hypothetical protein